MWYDTETRLINLSKAERIYVSDNVINIVLATRTEHIKFKNAAEAEEEYETIKELLMGGYKEYVEDIELYFEPE